MEEGDPLNEGEDFFFPLKKRRITLLFWTLGEDGFPENRGFFLFLGGKR